MHQKDMQNICRKQDRRCNQSINQSNQSINQPVNQSTNQSINRLKNGYSEQKSINQSIETTFGPTNLIRNSYQQCRDLPVQDTNSPSVGVFRPWYSQKFSRWIFLVPLFQMPPFRRTARDTQGPQGRHCSVRSSEIKPKSRANITTA